MGTYTIVGGNIIAGALVSMGDMIIVDVIDGVGE